MAAPPQVPTAPNTPLLNRYSNDGYSNTRPPSGPCNYRNMSIGADVRCGCRRFTDNALQVQLLDTPSGFCVCTHHSCYHDRHEDGPVGVTDVQVAEGSFLTPKKPLQPRLEDERPEVGPQDLLPDTFQWNRFLNSASQGSLPAIPSQCLLPSDNESRASSSQAGCIRPFAGLGLQTLSHIPKPDSAARKNNPDPRKGPLLYENGKAMQIYEDSNGHAYLQSLTEVATASMRSSQVVEAEAAFIRNGSIVQDALQKIADDRANGVTLALRTTEEATESRPAPIPDHENLLPRIQSIVRHVSDYPMKIQNHEHRLDQLENASFSQALLEEVREGHDYLGGRVGDLEDRMAEVEKQQQALNDASSVGSRQLLDASMDSRMSSTPSALSSNAIGPDYSRIEALESQLSDLQAVAPPSHSRPWEMEVVFLPSGPQLMGIWTPQHLITRQSRMSSMSGDEWTQTQYNSMAAAQASLAAHDQAIAWETSAKALSEEQSWLMAKACGPRSKVDQRLRSRGLVKLIQIKGPDARDVQAAMLSAFGKLLETLAKDPYSHHEHKGAIPRPLDKYLGLQASWVPLRKLHKDSCLQFLNIAEMVTPALWTAQFLSSSVAMRATGARRLYVTQPDGYIQHLGTTTTWTWQKLRQLDRVYPDTSFNHTPEADAHEPCWEFDERLDPPPSVHSSIESHISLSIRPIINEGTEQTSSSTHLSPASPNISTTPTSLAQPSGYLISPLKERHPFEPLRTRASMPSLIALNSPSQPKRRISSFNNEVQSSPVRPRILKRLRTRSPSRPRDTPRWSVGPPSPFAYAEDYVEMKRGLTPFAYATPHSNAPYIERRISSEFDDDGGDEQGSTTEEFEGGEQNALSDYDSGSSKGYSEDEWGGVEDPVEVQESGTRVLGMVISGSPWRNDDEESDDDGSSCPSEYPSNQPIGLVPGETKAGFRIHVDE
jgi:hypothetical protein